MATLEEKTVIQRISVNEQLVQYMQDAILSGKWKLNEKIPSEADLAEYFKVSKLTVRVALQQLIGMGILEKRVGDGTYVRKFDFNDYIQKGVNYYMHPELLDQVSDFRRGVELKCCELAIQNASEAEFAKLQGLSSEFTKLVHSLPGDSKTDLSESLFDEIADADMLFHRQICVMAHNELLLNAFDMARVPIREYQKIVFKQRIIDRMETQKDITKIKDIHFDIYQAMVNRDYETCARCYIEMIDRKVEL